ncbi:MAB_1171c family putative transporter [Streptomyces sp. NPDC020800]|uniref:MAB_1171c family putative transporter n=1 Tax=Streptomyces sp. NPDC020800 TaxID=3365092 RepID=UPI0037BC1E1B
MDSTDYYIPAFALGLALVVKLPDLWRTRHSPMSRSVFGILLTSSLVFVAGAPPTVGRVNSLIGISNISALIVYCILSAFSCASLVLLMHWRGGPEEVIRRHTRRWIAATGGAIAVYCGLFALSDVPVERRRDLDTYYATTPYIGAMIVLYLLCHTAICTIVMIKCWSWARVLGAGWTRKGLSILVAGYGLSLGYSLLKLLAVGLRWATGGGRWDYLSTDAATALVAVGGGVTMLGFLVPVIGPWTSARLHAWRSYRLMEPLWRALEPWNGPGTPMKLRRSAGIQVRATHRATEIADRLLNLAPYLSSEHRAAAQRYAESEGYDPVAARVVAEAATIHAALAAQADVTLQHPDRTLEPSGERPAERTPALLAGIHVTELSRHFSKINGAHLVGAATPESN